MRLTLKSQTSTERTCLHGIYNHKHPFTYLDLMAENGSRLSLCFPHSSARLEDRIKAALKPNITTPGYVIKTYKRIKKIKSIMHTARLKGGYYCLTYTPWIDADICGFFTVQDFNSRKTFTIKKGTRRNCKRIRIGLDLILQLHPKYSFDERRPLGPVVFFVNSPALKDELSLWSQYKADAFYMNFSLKELNLWQLTIKSSADAKNALRRIENAIKILNSKDSEIDTLSLAFPPLRKYAVENLVTHKELSDFNSDNKDNGYLSWTSSKDSHEKSK